MSEQIGTFEKPEDAGKGPKGEVARWLTELKLSEKNEKKWRESARRALDRYGNEHKSGAVRKTGHNILYSNVQTLLPSLFAQAPKPVVVKRFKDKDPVTKEACEIVERALTVQLEAYDFDGEAQLAVLDYVLPGRAFTRIKYKPIIEDKGEGEAAYEEKTYESVECETVRWETVRIGPARRWRDVPWIAFKHELVKEELEKQFPKFADKIELDISPDNEERNKDTKGPLDAFKRATVWEVWDKVDRKVKFICPTYADGPIKSDDDPLNLINFYPCPRPLYSIERTDTLVPIDEYSLYSDQAEELDIITRRIQKLTAALRNNGIYDATLKEMSKLSTAADNEYIPAESVSAFIDRGGLDKVVWTMPIEKLSAVLAQLYTQRTAVIQAIYEITGLSDVIRGVSDKAETATAQNIKSQFGGLRIQRRQREVQRFFRDIIALKAEVICEKFSPQTLQMMSGIQVTPEIMQVLQSDFLRSVKIDIETDSTIAPDEQEQKRSATELLSAVGSFLQGAIPAVQAGAVTQEQAKALLLFAVRRFRASRDVENILDGDGADATQQAVQRVTQQAQQHIQQLQQQSQEQMGQMQKEMQAAQQKAQQSDAAVAQAGQKTAQVATENTVLKAEKQLTDKQMLLAQREMELNMREEKLSLDQERAQLQIDKAMLELKSCMDTMKGEAGKADEMGADKSDDGALVEAINNAVSILSQPRQRTLIRENGRAVASVDEPLN